MNPKTGRWLKGDLDTLLQTLLIGLMFKYFIPRAKEHRKTNFEVGKITHECIL
jgi:hypothetical protein